MIILKFFLKIVGILFIIFLILFGVSFYQDYSESKFHNIEIPKNLSYLKKPKYSFTIEQKDSLKNLKIEKSKLLVFGGNGDYAFYCWPKIKEEGYIYIRGFELTQNIELMKVELPKRTKIIINSKTIDKGNLFTSATNIHEGTFDKFYPVRFELWFKAFKTKKEIKLTETQLLIDGWDR